MEITILQYVEGAKAATGVAVIIDVFRAFSTVCYVYGQGAREVFAVGDLQEAYAYKERHPESILMGERGGVIQTGFDFGNSPLHASRADFSGKTVVLTTSAGTQGIANATRADEILTGSFVNAGAIARYLRTRNPERVSLVCMGWEGKMPADEDTLCAEFLKNSLLGEPTDFGTIVHHLRHKSQTGRFLDVADKASAPPEDFDLCLSLDRFDFVLKAETGAAPLFPLRKEAR